MAKTFEELSVKFTADIADLNKKLDTIEGKLVKTGAIVEKQSAKMSKAFASFGRLLTVSAIVAGATALSRYQSNIDALGSELVDMSGRANVGIESLQRLRFAADQNGASAQGMDTALLKLNKAMGEARGGSDEMQRAFKSLGLLDLVQSGAKTDEVMVALADSFAQIKDPALQAAIASKIMGKTADELIPLLSGGSAELVKLAGQLPDAALKSDELAHKLDAMNDSTAKFNLKVQALSAWLEGGFVDAFNAAADAAEGFWFAMNGGLTGLAKSDAPLTNIQKNLLAATRANPVKLPERPKVKVDNPGVKNLFGSSGGGGSGGETKEAQATRQYEEAVSDLNFQFEQLTKSEEAAAYAETLRNELSRAGVTLDSARGEQIALLVARNDDMRKSVEAIAAAEEAAAEQGQKWIDMREQAGDAVASAFERAIVEGESLRDTFAGLLQDLAKLIFQKMVFDQISKAVGGSGGLIDAIIGGHAMGGAANPGNAYMVGEAGPEIFMPKVPGSIIPNRSIGQGGGGFTYAPTINSSGGNIAEIRQILAKDKQDLIRIMPKIIADKQRRNGLGGAFG